MEADVGNLSDTRLTEVPKIQALHRRLDRPQPEQQVLMRGEGKV